MKLKLGILAYDIALYKSYVFYSGRIRTLVAMATYSFHRFIMGKVEIGNFFCLIGDNRILFLQKCLLNSSNLCLLLKGIQSVGVAQCLFDYTSSIRQYSYSQCIKSCYMKQQSHSSESARQLTSNAADKRRQSWR